MEYSPYDFAQLIAAYNRQRTTPQFWLNFFSRTALFTDKFIDFEEVSQDYRKMAPFVAPNVQGRVIAVEGSNVRRFAPAYVKPEYAITPAQTLVRRAGETLIGGQHLSPQERKNLMVAELVGKAKSRISNREEWLASKAVIYGKVTISGIDYPTQTVDFGRDPSLTITLTGAATWDQTTATPLADITLGRLRVNTLSRQRISRLIFGQNAWQLFFARMGFDKPGTGNLLDTTFRGSDTSVSRLLDGYEGAEYAGTVTGINGQGTLECWVYHGALVDNDANGELVEEELLNTNDVVGVGEIDGVRCYGAIMDFDANMAAQQVYMKTYRKENPSAEFFLAQSSPLMVPGNPNTVFRIRVA